MTSFHKGNLCIKEVSNLSSYKLIWHLILLLLLSNNKEDSQKTQESNQSGLVNRFIFCKKNKICGQHISSNCHLINNSLA